MIKSKSMFEFRGRHEVLDADGDVIGMLEKEFGKSLCAATGRQRRAGEECSRRTRRAGNRDRAPLRRARPRWSRPAELPAVQLRDQARRRAGRQLQARARQVPRPLRARARPGPRRRRPAAAGRVHGRARRAADRTSRACIGSETPPARACAMVCTKRSSFRPAHARTAPHSCAHARSPCASKVDVRQARCRRPARRPAAVRPRSSLLWLRPSPMAPMSRSSAPSHWISAARRGRSEQHHEQGPASPSRCTSEQP